MALTHTHSDHTHTHPHTHSTTIQIDASVGQAVPSARRSLIRPPHPHPGTYTPAQWRYRLHERYTVYTH